MLETLGERAISGMAYFLISLPIIVKQGVETSERFAGELGGFLDDIAQAKAEEKDIFYGSLVTELCEGGYFSDKNYLNPLKEILEEYYEGHEIVDEILQHAEKAYKEWQKDYQLKVVLIAENQRSERCKCVVCSCSGYTIGIYVVDSEKFTFELLEGVKGIDKEAAFVTARAICDKKNWAIVAETSKDFLPADCNQRAFIERMLDVYNNVKAAGDISEADIYEIIAKNIFLPTEEGWLQIEAELKKIGFEIIKRYPKVYGYNLYCEFYKDGPRFILDIVDVSPFKVKFEMVDSYYNPRDIYEPECGPSYVDTAEISRKHQDYNSLPDTLKGEIIEENTFDNENWEPSQMRFIEAVFKNEDEIWPWVKELALNWKAEWEKEPEFTAA